jgi:hypothetical protein
MSTLTIRPAGPADHDLVARLSQLDSQRPPTGEVLIAFRDDDAVAAIGVESGQVVADPFQHTMSVVEMLRATAARADALAERSERVNGHVRELPIAA